MQCLRCLREVLTYFLGEPRPVDQTVWEVTRITQRELEAVAVDPVAVAAAADNERALSADAANTAAAVDRWSPFVASDGRRVRVSCALEPILELKFFTRIGNRIVRRVLQADTEVSLTAAELRTLSQRDIERVDCAPIARGLDRLRLEAGADQPLSLIAPVSCISLSSRPGRATVARMLGEAKSFVRKGIICEVCDIEDVPRVALLEATSSIKPYCVFLIGRLATAPKGALENLRGAGLQALSFAARRIPGLGQGRDRFREARRKIGADLQSAVTEARWHRRSGGRVARQSEGGRPDYCRRAFLLKAFRPMGPRGATPAAWSAVQANLAGEKRPIGLSVAPVVARSARISPMMLANLKPWPEQGDASTIRGQSGCGPRMKCSSGVRV